MPELVLMPAPVITTTFRAFQSALAISCRWDSQSGVTWVVGIAISESNHLDIRYMKPVLLAAGAQ